MDEKTRKEFEDRVVLDSLSLKCEAGGDGHKSTAVLSLYVDGVKKGNFCSACAGVRANVEVETLIRAVEVKSVIEPVLEEVKVEEPPKPKKEKDNK